MIDRDRVRRFLTYCREPHETGRFGSRQPNARVMARPSTLHTWFRDLHAFCSFCRDEKLTEVHAMANMRAPKLPEDQVQPFTSEQLEALLRATATSACPDRDRALILVLLDSGMRVGELCALRIEDTQRTGGQLSVLGKGGKRRKVYLGTKAQRSVQEYLARCRPGADPGEPLFTSLGGNRRGEGITSSGVQRVIRECGQTAGLTGVRCSPHTLRHTFAVSFLRGGGNLFELQQLMGHADLTVLRRYVALAEDDLARAHREASPADRLGL